MNFVDQLLATLGKNTPFAFILIADGINNMFRKAGPWFIKGMTVSPPQT